MRQPSLMARYRRLRRPGGTYFFTVNLTDRSSSLLIDRVADLRKAVSLTRQERWFKIDAMVVLPDHLHAIWTLPEDDSDFSTRWRLIKTRFSRAVGISQPCGASQAAKNERGIWQRRFWEHLIRDEADYAAHIAYCWANPVKHVHVMQAVDWPYSSFQRDIRNGRAAPDWGCGILAKDG